jgi:hypothetical protein
MRDKRDITKGLLADCAKSNTAKLINNCCEHFIKKAYYKFMGYGQTSMITAMTYTMAPAMSGRAREAAQQGNQAQSISSGSTTRKSP